MSNTRRYFFTGDTHFSHRNVINYCNRPFETAAEMNEKLIENWNKVVTKSDIVYHVGDVAFEKFTVRASLDNGGILISKDFVVDVRRL